MSGYVRGIHVAAEQGDSPTSLPDVQAVADAGLRGDRYFRSEGTFADRDGCALTLIAAEALTAAERDYDIELEPGAHRRNLTTEGVALNHLVGERFRIGEAVCLGTELCEPCSYLERHLGTEGSRMRSSTVAGCAVGYSKVGVFGPVIESEKPTKRPEPSDKSRPRSYDHAYDGHDRRRTPAPIDRRVAG